MEILKRALSALLAMVLVCGMLPMSIPAGATETEPLSETLPAVTEETAVPETTAAAVETTAAEETIPETTAAVEEAPSREGQTPQEPVTYYWYVTSEEKSKTETTQIVEQDAGGIFHSHDEKQTVTATVKELNEVYMNPVSTLSLGEDEYGDLTFTTFADLQELASRTYSDWTYVYYAGRDALTIEESLTLPEQLCLYFYEDNSKVIVPEGVTLRVNSTMVVDTLVVEGVVVANNYGCLRVQKELKITGEIKLNTPIYVSASAAITGAENIHPQNEWTTVYVSHDQLANAADLEAAVQIAENDRSGWIHMFEVSTYMTGALVLDRSLTLPANSELSLYGEDSITIAEGCTLTLNCEYANSDVPLIVKGALVNNCSDFYLYSPVTFAETGSYSGTGTLYISQDFFGQPADAVPGLDMAGVIIGEAEWGYSWTVQDAASVTKLATPKDLQWNKALFYGNEQPTLVDAYGNVAWKAVRPDLNSASIRFYKVGDSEPWSSHSWWFDDYEGEIWRSIDGFATDDPESGTYYFTVQSTANRTGYASSDIAVSDTWTYTKPSAQLANCPGLYWDGNTARWSAPSNADETTRFAIEFYYADSLDATPDSCGRSWGFFYPYAAISEEGYAYRGPGYYFFKVRALSGDITKICNGEWSEMSAPLYFDADSSTEPVEPTIPTSGTCGGNLTWEFDPETGTLTITGIGEMWNFIASLLQRSADPVVPWAAFQSEIKQVVLPEGLTSVGNNAFNGCENLTEITIPATVVTIGTSAFRNSGLTAITFEGDAPAEIGEAAFENVTATISYPEDNETWTEDKMQNYGGEITWGTESAHEYQLGDVNHDGKINAKDSTLILQYSVGVLKDTSKFCETCANVNGDSKLNAKDATMILQYSVGLRTDF